MEDLEEEFLLCYDYYVLLNYLVSFWEHSKVLLIREKPFDGKSEYWPEQPKKCTAAALFK